MKRIRTLDDRSEGCPADLPQRRVPDARHAARAVRVLRALADPTRFRIFALVAARPEPICVCDIVARFELRQPTISHHLKVLRQAGLVTAERRGTWAWYGVDPRAERTVRAILEGTFRETTPLDW